MGISADRRRIARLTVPRRWGGGDTERHVVRLLELSALGARITHREPLHAGGIGYVDLPPALGATRLMGRLVWTRLRRTEQTLDGNPQPLFESGLEFTSLTSEQRAALTTVLTALQTGEAAAEREPST
jgi:PilZ domain